VVGGGAAGCIVARRLADRLTCRITLLEAGPTDEGDPLATHLSRLDDQDDSYDWGYSALPVRGGRHAISYARAKMLGGCANHNDCAFIAPFPSDLERWVELGAAGWGPREMAPFLRRIEASLHIESSPPGNALSRAFLDAAGTLGLEERNFRNNPGAGCGWFPLNARGDLRQSSSIAYLHPLDDLPDNLRVITGINAHRLILEHGVASGVATDRGVIRARREIILCAGSINTPKLLMLSGIGPAGHLQELGIPVVRDLPGVGRNLLDHVAANVACELKQPCPPWERTPCEATAMIQLDPEAPAPEILYHFVLTLREKYQDNEFFGDFSHGVKISPNVARPRSRGSLRLAGNDPHLPPVIDLNYLSDPEGHDRRVLLGGLRFARELAATEPLGQWIQREIHPGPEAVRDEDILASAMESCETVYHPSGTCRMGSADSDTSVVTPDLKVLGMDHLRVADASVFPDMVTVNICNTVMMVAEKAADLVVLNDR
jgi:choline dehydrogenase-like flavoprotein